MCQADTELRILDVRTPEEYVFVGHAPMAVNIPLAFLAYVWDDAKQGFPWELNPEFVELVTERFDPDETILVSCRSGGRSAIAISLLAEAGFTKAHNVLDGMEGGRVDDPTASSAACG
jgi:rhodanese-related sulfurtransferase